jgi:hypothetical protein
MLIKQINTRTAVALVVAAAITSSWAVAQTNAPKEEFSAVAIVNNNISSGIERVMIQITRWSSEEEGKRLVATLREKGPGSLLDELQDLKPVGTIRTPDSLGYDLRYAHQEKMPDGGRRVVIATDRPISFWEARNQPRTIDYPFTVIQMEFGPEGKGKGTMTYATRITPRGDLIELENFSSAPVMLNDIEAKPIK